MITVGPCRGKAIKGSVQIGETDRGVLQIAIDMELKVKETDSAALGQMTTFLFFSELSAVYSYERLRVIGWTGEGPDDVDKLDNIYDKWVDCRVTAPEQYKATDGTMKMGNSKLEIMTGAGGRVALAKPLDIGTFKARLKAIGTTTKLPTSPPSEGPEPPF